MIESAPTKTPAGRPVLVTCGPAFEPVDEVRRLTNVSTGELGIVLANELAAAGRRVICFMGEGATCRAPLCGVEVVPFTTNQSLLDRLHPWAGDAVAAVFHAAALCDYRLKQTLDDQGRPLTDAKISSRSGRITLEMEPAPKIIGALRSLFPKARIVGWKYELDGSPASALARGWQQIAESRTDVCVVNGRAYGQGFGICLPPNRVERVPDKPSLAQWLTRWLATQP